MIHLRRLTLGLSSTLRKIVIAALWLPTIAGAQITMDVKGVGATQLPISVSNFVVEGAAPVSVSDVVREDLKDSGAFRIIDYKGNLSDTGDPDWADLRKRESDSIVGGSITKLADGKYDVRFRLSDVVRENSLGGQSFTVSAGDLRQVAHRIADFVYEKLTGEKGVFSTRIAFITKAGSQYRLNVADWDGQGVQVAATSPEPLISPVWSPDGSRLAYVSFESRKPVVYVHTLATGQRAAVANFKGSNSAPAWSPDGKQLAVTLTRDGVSQVYLIPAEGGDVVRRLTQSQAIDTEPTFAPDGKSIFFTSDRGGSPQIYRVSVSGGDPARVTFNGSYNVSPKISPDGRNLVFVSRRDGRLSVVLRELAGNAERVLTETGNDESPSFSPNGKWVLYTTTAGGHDMLMAVTTDGRVSKRVVSPGGDIREPAWGPFVQ